MNEPAKEPMLVQLHWQNRDNLEETTLVGQTAYVDSETFWAWLRELTEKKRHQCPEGWMPLVCTEDSPMFVRAAA